MSSPHYEDIVSDFAQLSCSFLFALPKIKIQWREIMAAGLVCALGLSTHTLAMELLTHTEERMLGCCRKISGLPPELVYVCSEPQMPGFFYLEFLPVSPV